MKVALDENEILQILENKMSEEFGQTGLALSSACIKKSEGGKVVYEASFGEDTSLPPSNSGGPVTTAELNS